MPVITEGLNLGDLLKYEAPNLYSRDRITVASGQNLPLGTVLGIVTAGYFFGNIPWVRENLEKIIWAMIIIPGLLAIWGAWRAGRSGPQTVVTK